MFPAIALSVTSKDIHNFKLKRGCASKVNTTGQSVTCDSGPSPSITVGELLNTDLKPYYISHIIADNPDTPPLNGTIRDTSGRYLVKAGLNLEAIGNPDLGKLFRSCTDTFVLDCDDSSESCSIVIDSREGIACKENGYGVDDLTSYFQKGDDDVFKYRLKYDNQSLFESVIKGSELPKISYISLTITDTNKLTDKTIDKYNKIRSILPNTHFQISGTDGINSVDTLAALIENYREQQQVAHNEVEFFNAEKRRNSKKIIELSARKLIHETGTSKTYILKDSIGTVDANPYLFGFYVLNESTGNEMNAPFRDNNDNAPSDAGMSHQTAFALSYYVANCLHDYSSDTITRHSMDILDKNYASLLKSTNDRPDYTAYPGKEMATADRTHTPADGNEPDALLPKIHANICKTDRIITDITSMGYDESRKLPYYMTYDGKRLYFVNDTSFSCSSCYQHTYCHIIGNISNDYLLTDISKSVARNRHGKETVCNNGKIVSEDSSDTTSESADINSKAVDIIDRMLRSHITASIQ
jgi:hypothetical protein